MAEMLTAKDMQELLQVNRSTIYRMAEAGRLPAVKVGKQWRFPGDLVKSWLTTQTAAPAPLSQVVTGTSEDDFALMLPLECVQLVQDTFADALGVMLVITDMGGKPVTRVSNPCGLFAAISQVPNAVQKCIESWHHLASTVDLEPKLTRSHLGLLCARGMIRVGTELKGMVVVGGIKPDDWPPPADEVQAMADEFGVEPEVLDAHVSEVFCLDESQRALVLSLVQRIANIVAHIIKERITLTERLQSISVLTKL